MSVVPDRRFAAGSLAHHANHIEAEHDGAPADADMSLRAT